MVNKAIILGRLGSDPEARYTQSGSCVCNLSIATNESWVDKSGAKQERTEWHRVVVFGKQAENCSVYLRSGDHAYIEGRIQTRTWEKDDIKRYATEIMANNVTFLGKKKSSPNKPDPQESKEVRFDENFTGDEIPF